MMSVGQLSAGYGSNTHSSRSNSNSPASSHASKDSVVRPTEGMDETEEGNSTLKDDEDNRSSSPSSNSELGPVQDAPEDLSVKKTRPNSPQSRSSNSPGSQGSGSSGEATRPKRIKPIPPPLDLNARTLSPCDTLPQALPRSPGDFPRECLPIRKRHVVNVKEEKPSGNSLGLPHGSTSSQGPSILTPSSLASLTPSSAGININFSHFPVPPPLLPIPGLSQYPKSPFLTASSNGFPTPPTDLHSPGYPWASPTLTAMGLLPTFSQLPTSPLPFPHNSSLLSPSPSYHSSSNSSREDLPGSHAGTHMAGKTTLSAPMPRYGPVPSLDQTKSPAQPHSSSSPQQSPLLRGPLTWPIPVWQCFMSGTQVRFLLLGTDTPWQKAEELGWKDKLALKVDFRNPYQYAPNGLILLEFDLGQSEANITVESKPVLRVRMRPYNVPEMSSVDMLAECSMDHPFFVKDKGWCSYRPRATLEKYGIPCQDLTTGDICLPPNHADATVVRTPDLCDRFKKFEFSSQDLLDQLSPSPGGPRTIPTSGGGGPLRHNIASLLSSARGRVMSPPMSPAKKKTVDPDKPKRPMNGFMLFAKKFRLELIQQHPGKDNRAISVLLGEAWKGLPLEEREKYSQKAKVLADEQKKLHPDCWKRKRSLSTANQPPTTTQSANHSPIHHKPATAGASNGGSHYVYPGGAGHGHHSVPGTPTSLHSMPGTPTGHMSFLLPPHPSFNMNVLNAANAGLLGAQTVAMNPS